MAGQGGDAGGSRKSRVMPSGGEAVVLFTTKLPAEFQVPEEDLVVPASLARYGLSEVVNRLLSLEKPVPFDFIANGELLRTSVEQHLQALKLTSEKVLRLEYILALSEPELSQVDEVQDWVSDSAALGAFPSRWFAVVSYDGTARFYQEGTSKLTTRISDTPLTSVASLAVDKGQSSHLVAGGKDGSVRCWVQSHGADGSAASGNVAVLRAPGRPQGVEAVAINDDGTLLASAGWDQQVCVWNADQDVFAPPVGSKRKLSGGNSCEGKAPKFVLKGHTQVVTCLKFGAHSQYPFTLLSSSWDSSVRVWDIAAADCVCNWTCARAVTSFSTSPSMPHQLVTSHEDGHVSLWDVRAPPHATVKGAVSLDSTAGLPLASAQSPHSRLAAQVAWCPEDTNRIASVGHDGRLCILDPRSPRMPLQCAKIGKVGPSPTKLLCCSWLARDSLVTGGSDGCVVRVSLGANALITDSEIGSA